MAIPSKQRLCHDRTFDQPWNPVISNGIRPRFLLKWLVFRSFFFTFLVDRFKNKAKKKNLSKESKQVSISLTQLVSAHFSEIIEWFRPIFSLGFNLIRYKVGAHNKCVVDYINLWSCQIYAVVDECVPHLDSWILNSIESVLHNGNLLTIVSRLSQ